MLISTKFSKFRIEIERFPTNNYFFRVYLKNLVQKTCRKSQKGVYLQRQKPQKGVKYNRAKISKRCKWHHDETKNIPATP
jgi:hypothetical protein